MMRRRWRWFRWRGALLVAVFCCGLVALLMGVDVSDRPGLPDEPILTKVYYSLGLFVLGGMDLGVPRDGPPVARTLLWVAYFAAPAITASALIEGVMRAVNPEAWLLRRLSDHVVIAGCGKLGMLYLARLRESDETCSVVMVDLNPDANTVEEAREVHGAQVLAGDVTSPAVLRALNTSRARRVMLLTGDDVANLDAAATIATIAPEVAPRTVVHVSDLTMKRVAHRTSTAKRCETFNTHQIAAQHVVETKLLARFEGTEARDTLVLGGFGRFGQTVLDELQKAASGKLARVIVVDIAAEVHARVFSELVGFASDFEHHVVTGDVRDSEAWHAIERRFDLDTSACTFVIGSGHDRINLRTALWLSERFPDAYVIARTFRRSAFADEASAECGFDVVSVADIVGRAMPTGWFDASE